MLTKIILHGTLAEQFGEVHEKAAVHPREAVRAMVVTVEGFADALRDMELCVVLDNGTAQYEIGEGEMLLGCEGKTLHLVPEVGGSGGRGGTKILIGAALIAGAFIFAPAASAAMLAKGGATFGANLGATIGMGFTYGNVALFGAMMVLGGASMMLAGTPDAGDATDREKDEASFLFSGPVNLGRQGNVVALPYGHIRVGSVAVSNGITTEKIRIYGGGVGGGGDYGGGAYDDLLNTPDLMMSIN